MTDLRTITAVVYSAVASIIATVAITIASELSAAFKNWLAHFTGHHWLTKSCLSIITFAASFIIFRIFFDSSDIAGTQHSITALIWTVISGFVILLCFYLLKHFK